MKKASHLLPQTAFAKKAQALEEEQREEGEPTLDEKKRRRPEQEKQKVRS